MKYTDANTDFKDVVELYVVYISDFDFLGGNKTVYHVEKVLRETGEVVDDGLHEIFVNTAVKDGTDISELMTCFTQSSIDNPKFPKLSNEVSRLKLMAEGGAPIMCGVMEELNKAVLEDGYFGLVADGIVAPSVMAKRLNMSMDELSSKMAEYGYKIPDTLDHSEKC